MGVDRRDFLKGSLIAGAAVAGGVPLSRAAAMTATPAAARRLDLLILGGTSFLGPHQIRYALERGHRISIFTRGKTQPTFHKSLFPKVERLIGDRNDDLSALKGRRWDAVIDNSCQRVEWARDSAAMLKDHAEQYLFVSSTGVYYPYKTVDIREDTQPLLSDDPPLENPSYGVMKSLSEIAVRKAFGDERATVVRPQYIVGPGDRKDRFTYWPLRISRGGEVLVPGKQDDPIMWIDVRDLTEWMVRLMEDRVGGVFNAAGPASPCGMAEFVYGVRAATSAPVTWTWIDDYEFLEAHQLYYSIPWLIPTGDMLGGSRINIDRARAAGLAFRPLATTCTDTLAWWHSDAVAPERKAAPEFPLNEKREQEILTAWKNR
jgi:2'-hydroxyisoflavone reductase